MMKNEARRDFLKKGLFGMAGAAMLPSAISGKMLKPSSFQPDNKLVYRKLGKTGLDIPVISLGAGDTNNPNLVKACHEAGIRLFFSATYYGEGNNEKMLGDALRGFPRDSFLVGTAAIPKGIDHKNGVYTKDSTREGLVKTVEDSLKRFGFDHMDFLLLPFAAKRESVFFEPLLRAMEDLKKQGKTRFIGIASHSWVDEALRAAADTKIYDMAMPAYNFRAENKQAMNEALAYATHAGLGIIAMKTQAGGYWDKERTQPINSKATLRWVLQNEHVTSAVSGMSKFEELQQNLALMSDLKLTGQDMKDLKLAYNEGTPGLYCKQCRKCIPQCKRNLDIPTLMRSYMYAYGYRNLEHAQHTLIASGITGNPCGNCSSCDIKCTSGFNVREKIQDIARLQDVPADLIKV